MKGTLTIRERVFSSQTATTYWMVKISRQFESSEEREAILEELYEKFRTEIEDRELVFYIKPRIRI